MIVGNSTPVAGNIGWCRRVTLAKVTAGDPQWLDVGATSLVASLALLVGLFILTARLSANYSSAYSAHERILAGRRGVQALPVFHVFAQCSTLLFLIQVVVLLLPLESTLRLALAHAMYACHGFTDTFLLFFGLSKSADARGGWRAALLSSAIVVARASVVARYAHDANKCSWCGVFFPVPQAFYLDVAFVIVFALMLASSYRHYRFDKRQQVASVCGYNLRLRPSLRLWAQFMLSCYGTVCVATLLAIEEIDFGYCFLTTVVAVYTGGYAFMMYRVFMLDSAVWQDLDDRGEPLISVHGHNPDSDSKSHELAGAGPIAGAATDLSRSSSSVHLLQVGKQLERAGVPVLEWNSLEFVDRLGSGGYGEVYGGRWQTTPVAIKRLFPLPQSSESREVISAFVSEATVLSKLRHPNVIQLLGVCMTRTGSLCIVTELAVHGSVWSLINQHGKLRPSSVMRILLHCARGMAHLHSLDPPIMHRDLKCQNLLVDEAWTTKLCDMGLAREVVAAADMTRVGSVQWCAPEMMAGDVFSHRADVFSFGVCVWELLEATMPHAGVTALALVTKVAQGSGQLPTPVGQSDLVSLFSDCTRRDPDSRPSFAEVAERLEDLVTKNPTPTLALC